MQPAKNPTHLKNSRYSWWFFVQVTMHPPRSTYSPE